MPIILHFLRGIPYIRPSSSNLPIPANPTSPLLESHHHPTAGTLRAPEKRQKENQLELLLLYPLPTYVPTYLAVRGGTRGGCDWFLRPLHGYGGSVFLCL